MPSLVAGTILLEGLDVALMSSATQGGGVAGVQETEKKLYFARISTNCSESASKETEASGKAASNTVFSALCPAATSEDGAHTLVSFSKGKEVIKIPYCHVLDRKKGSATLLTVDLFLREPMRGDSLIAKTSLALETILRAKADAGQSSVTQMLLLRNRRGRGNRGTATVRFSFDSSSEKTARGFRVFAVACKRQENPAESPRQEECGACTVNMEAQYGGIVRATGYVQMMGPRVEWNASLDFIWAGGSSSSPLELTLKNDSGTLLAAGDVNIGELASSPGGGWRTLQSREGSAYDVLLLCARYHLPSSVAAPPAGDGSRWKRVYLELKCAHLTAASPQSSFAVVVQSLPSCVSRSRSCISGSFITDFAQAQQKRVDWNESCTVVCPVTSARPSDESSVVVHLWQINQSGENLKVLGSTTFCLASLQSEPLNDARINISPETSMCITARIKGGGESAVQNAEVYSLSIFRARNMTFASNSLHIEVHARGEKCCQTPACINGGANPVWRQTFRDILAICDGNLPSVKFHVFSENRPVGVATFEGGDPSVQKKWLCIQDGVSTIGEILVGLCPTNALSALEVTRGTGIVGAAMPPKVAAIAPNTGNAAPGYIYVHIMECAGIPSSAGLVSVNASISSARWSSSTGAIEVADANSPVKFNETFRIPLHWCMRQRFAPILNAVLMTQSSVLQPQTVPAGFVSLPLASMVMQPSHILDTWLDFQSASGASTGAKVHIRTQFKVKKDRKTPFSHAGTSRRVSGKLHVHVISAERLKGMASPFANLRLFSSASLAAPASARTCSDKDGGSEPTWNEHFVLPLSVLSSSCGTPLLCLDVNDDANKACRTLTTVLPIFSHVTCEGHLQEGAYPLTYLDETADPKKRGAIRLSLQFVEDAPSDGDVGAANGEDSEEIWKVTAVAARNAFQHGWKGRNDYYLCVIPVVGAKELREQAQETFVAQDAGQEPMWNDTLRFKLTRSPSESVEFRVELRNDNFADIDESEVAHCTADLPPGGNSDAWHPMKSFRGKNGSVRLIIQKVSADSPDEPQENAPGYFQITNIRANKLRRKGIRLHEARLSLLVPGSNGSARSTALRDDDNSPVIAWEEEFFFLSDEMLFEKGVQLAVYSSDSSQPCSRGFIRANEAACMQLTPAFSEGVCELEELEGEHAGALKSFGRIDVSYRYLPPLSGSFVLNLKNVVFLGQENELGTFGRQEVFFKFGLGARSKRYVKSSPFLLSMLSKSGAYKCEGQRSLRFPFSTLRSFSRPSLHIVLCLSTPIDGGRSVIGEGRISLMDSLHGERTAKQEVCALMFNGAETNVRVNFSVNFTAHDEEATKRHFAAPDPGESNAAMRGSADAAGIVFSERVKALKRLFYRIDADGNGSVNFAELKAAMSQENFLASSGLDASRMFFEMDTDKSGRVSWGEFRAFASKFCVSAGERGDDDTASAETSSAGSTAAREMARKPNAKKHAGPSPPAKRAWDKASKRRPLHFIRRQNVDASLRGELNDPTALRDEIVSLRKKVMSLEDENKALRVAARTSEKRARDEVRNAQNEMNSYLYGYQSRAAASRPMQEPDGNDAVSMESMLMEQNANLMARVAELEALALDSSQRENPPLRQPAATSIIHAGYSPRTAAAEASDLNARCAQLEEQLEKKQSKVNAAKEKNAELLDDLEKEKARSAQLKVELESVLQQLMQSQREKFLAESKTRWKRAQSIAEQRKLSDEMDRRNANRRKSISAASVLQNKLRSRMVRRDYLRVKDSRTRAATRIQSRYRSKRASDETHRYRISANKSACCIQSRYRGVAARRNARQRAHAATQLQSTYRGHLARRDAASAAEQHENAIKLQALMRQRNAKRELAALREERQVHDDAARTIQIKARARFARKKQRVDDAALEHELAAARIQSISRGREQRKEYRRLRKIRSEKEAAATKIQRRARFNASRRDARYFRARGLLRSSITGTSLARESVERISRFAEGEYDVLRVTAPAQLSRHELSRKIRRISGEIDAGGAYSARNLSANLEKLASFIPVPLHDIETESSASETSESSIDGDY